MSSAKGIWFYLSFADPTKPEGSQFLGGCYVKVTDEHRDADEFSALTHPRRVLELGNQELLMWRAVRQARRLGINPGGEVMALGPLSEETMDANTPPEDRERLLSVEDLGEFVDPFGRTFFASKEPTGETRLDIAPGQYVCDFCMAPGPTWEYPCGPVKIVGNPNYTDSDDSWSACDRCHELIQGGDVGAMVEHMVTSHAAMPLEPGFRERPRKDALRLARINLEAFLAAREGEPFRIDPATGMPIDG